ncbi:hypothetical protein WA026_006352 [Henosepilachna vigintioctopunctata]|uniref:Uncharacterized protein n=1 Tax=Henosepilachna vigintioctopunctata TaxID=420089 RepID=A0AAW1TPI3_9CUCU
MESHDLKGVEKSYNRTGNDCGKSQANENKTIGSTEIISKYDNYHITEIVTDPSGEEVTEISKITKEALEKIIGGCMCINSRRLSETDSLLVKHELLEETESCNTDKTSYPGDSSKLLRDVEMPTVHTPTEVLSKHFRKCYVRLEYNQIVEHLQNIPMNTVKTEKKETKSRLLVSNNNNAESKIPILCHGEENLRISDLDSPSEYIECAGIKQESEGIKIGEAYTRDCYVKMKMDPDIENMQNKITQISQMHLKNTDKNILKFCDKNQHNTEEYSPSNIKSENRKRKKLGEYNINQSASSLNDFHKRRCQDVNRIMKSKRPLPDLICESSLSQEAIRKVLTEMGHYERENNILLYENLRIENSLIKAINKIKFLESELDNLKRINNYTFLTKYFNENEITALLKNTIIDWDFEMITKAMQLRFACGNESYEELSKDFNLLSLKILRSKVHNSQFDVALLAKDMIHF